MWMVFVRRSKSFKSVFSSTTCFNASCAGEPSISHFVLRCALGEMGSCAQRLYSTVESQSCLSAVWWRMLTHFSLRSWGFPSHVIADHHIWFVTDFIQGERSLHSFFLAFVASLDLMFLVKCHTSTWCSTPRSLYSLHMSALIPVCLSVPTTPTGMPLFSAQSRQSLKPRFSIACELILCLTWQTSNSTIFSLSFVHHGVLQSVVTLSAPPFFNSSFSRTSSPHSRQRPNNLSSSSSSAMFLGDEHIFS